MLRFSLQVKLAAGELPLFKNLHCSQLDSVDETKSMVASKCNHGILVASCISTQSIAQCTDKGYLQPLDQHQAFHM